MRIELVGLPGSGKTYVAKKIAEQFSLPMIEVTSRVGRSFYAVIFISLHPIIFLSILSLILKENSPHSNLLDHKIRFIFFRAIGREGKLILWKKGVIDEGLLQFSYSLYESKIENGEYFRIIRKLASRKVFFVEVKSAVRNSRMQKRRRVPRAIFGEEYMSHWEPVLEYNSPIICRELSKYFDIKIFPNG